MEEKNQNQNHTSRKNIERKMQRTIKEVFQINGKEEKKMEEKVIKNIISLLTSRERERKEKGQVQF